MKMRYDPEVDVLYISILNEKAFESEEMSEDIIADYTEDNKVIGIEVLNASKRLIEFSNIEKLVEAVA